MIRFLMVPPACTDDAISLTNVLNFLEQILDFRCDLNIWDSIFQSIKVNLLNLLDMEITIPDIHGCIQDELLVSILKFIKIVFETTHPERIIYLVKTSKIVNILTNFILQCFSKKQMTLMDRDQRILSLRLLLSILIHSQIIFFIEPQIICELIAILVKAFGCLHQSITQNDNFSYQDSTTYLLLGTSLRSISRLLLNVYFRNEAEWVW